MFYTYILKGDIKYYVGYTSDINRRLSEHKSNSNTKYTSHLGDIELIGYFEYESKREAIIQEKKIKKSGHISRYIDYTNFIKYMGY